MDNLRKVGAWMAGLLFYGNLFISFCAVGLLWLTYLQTGHPPRLDHLTAFVFFGTWFNYTFQRLVSIRKLDEQIETPLMNWISGNHATQIGILAIAAIGLVYHLLFIWQDHFFILAAIGFMALAYSIPVKLPGGRVFRIREFGVSKIFLVALVWGAVTSILPFSYFNAQWWDGEVLLVFVQRFLLVFALILPFDIRDIEIDRAYGLTTIPRSLGINGTLVLGGAMLLGMMVAEIMRTVWFPRYGNVPIALGFAVSTIAGMALLRLSGKKRGDYFYLGWVDGVMLAQFTFCWIMIRVW